MRIGLDIDEVLAETIQPLVAFINQRHGTQFDRDAISNYNLWEEWNMDYHLVAREITVFLDECLMNIQPVKGAKEGLSLLQGRHDLIAISARPKAFCSQTREWLLRTFGDIFVEIHLTGSFHEAKQKKIDICRNLGVHVLVDDGPEHLIECLDASLPAIVMNAPWNRSLPKSLVRAYNWRDIVEYINSFEMNLFGTNKHLGDKCT